MGFLIVKDDVRNCTWSNNAVINVLNIPWYIIQRVTWEKRQMILYSCTPLLHTVMQMYIIT